MKNKYFDNCLYFHNTFYKVTYVLPFFETKTKQNDIFFNDC